MLGKVRCWGRRVGDSCMSMNFIFNFFIHFSCTNMLAGYFLGRLRQFQVLRYIIWRICGNQTLFLYISLTK